MNYRNGAAAKVWVGPVKIRNYLSNVVRDENSRPPDAPGVYLVSEQSWLAPPNREAGVIYVGQAHYLRYRIGQLLIDLLGFTSDDRADGEAYEHRGGHTLWHRYCLERRVEPVDLYVAWYPQCECLDCAEAKLVELLSTQLKRPSRNCSRHIPMLDLTNNCSVLASASARSKRLSDISKN